MLGDNLQNKVKIVKLYDAGPATIDRYLAILSNGEIWDLSQNPNQFRLFIGKTNYININEILAKGKKIKAKKIPEELIDWIEGYNKVFVGDSGGYI